MKMDIELDGIDGVAAELDSIRELGQELGQDGELLQAIFDERFMTQYTDFEDIWSFYGASQWDVESFQEAAGLPEDEFNEYVRENTVFDTAEEMLEMATQ